TRLQRLFSLLAVINICKQEVPGGYRTCRTLHREAANLEPSVNAIRPSTTMLNFIGLPGFYRLHTDLDDARKVFRMNDIDESPVLQLLTGFAEILQGLSVKKLHLARSTRRSHEPGNVVDDLPPGQFPRTQSILSAFAILNIQIDSIPFDDLAQVVAQRVGAKQKPAMSAIETAHARFGLAWLSGSSDALPHR